MQKYDQLSQLIFVIYKKIKIKTCKLIIFILYIKVYLNLNQQFFPPKAWSA